MVDCKVSFLTDEERLGWIYAVYQVNGEWDPDIPFDMIYPALDVGSTLPEVNDFSDKALKFLRTFQKEERLEDIRRDVIKAMNLTKQEIANIEYVYFYNSGYIFLLSYNLTGETK